VKAIYMNEAERFRKHYDEWKKTAPDCDSKIFPAPIRKTVKPRHRALSLELSALLAWRGNAQQAASPLATNFSLPGNDNSAAFDTNNGKDGKREDRSLDSRHEYRPTAEEIMKGLADVEFNERGIPIGGDIEYGPEYSSKRFHGLRTIHRLGSLRFAPYDKILANDDSPPRGSLVAWRASATRRGRLPGDAFSRPKGSKPRDQEDVTATNNHFAEMLGAQPHRYIPTRRRPPQPGATSLALHIPPFGTALSGTDEFSAYRRPTLPKQLSGTTPLPEARAWAGLPPAPIPQDTRPALPCGSCCVLDAFVGHHRRSVVNDKPHNTASAWLERLTEDKKLRLEVGPEAEAVLDASLTAQSFKKLGQEFRHVGKTAERQGKRILRAAVSTLSGAIEKIAA
jgi:hypothetical protein